MSGLQAFHARMAACRAGGAEDEGQRAQPPPLFRLALSLIGGEVAVAPSTAEATRQLQRALRCVVESARPFYRWMDGTCIEAPPQ